MAARLPATDGANLVVALHGCPLLLLYQLRGTGVEEARELYMVGPQALHGPPWQWEGLGMGRGSPGLGHLNGFFSPVPPQNPLVPGSGQPVWGGES